MESPAVGAGGPGKPEGDTVHSEAPPSPSVFVPAPAGGCLGLTSCRNAAIFLGSLWCPSPSLQTERPGLGGARWEPGAHRSQHTQPGAACPPLMNRQSRPPGGRGQAAPAGGEEEEPSLLTSLHFLGLCSPQALPAPDRRAGGRGPACQDHPAPSLLRLRPPLPQAGSGHEILLKTFPLQNNPSKYVFENRLLIRTGRS